MKYGDSDRPILHFEMLIISLCIILFICPTFGHRHVRFSYSQIVEYNRNKYLKKSIFIRSLILFDVVVEKDFIFKNTYKTYSVLLVIDIIVIEPVHNTHVPISVKDIKCLLFSHKILQTSLTVSIVINPIQT